MRKAEREELQARVDAQAQEVFRDDASMKGFLNFMAQCTPQSTRNLLILYEQDPTITHPRTFDKWKEAGRSLRSGVTGYAFYADQEYEREDGTKGNGFTTVSYTHLQALSIISEYVETELSVKPPARSKKERGDAR